MTREQGISTSKKVIQMHEKMRSIVKEMGPTVVREIPCLIEGKNMQGKGVITRPLSDLKDTEDEKKKYEGIDIVVVKPEGTEPHRNDAGVHTVYASVKGDLEVTRHGGLAPQGISHDDGERVYIGQKIVREENGNEPVTTIISEGRTVWVGPGEANAYKPKKTTKTEGEEAPNSEKDEPKTDTPKVFAVVLRERFQLD